MYYLLTLERELDIQPRFFGKELRSKISDLLMNTVRVAAVKRSGSFVLQLLSFSPASLVQSATIS